MPYRLGTPPPRYTRKGEGSARTNADDRLPGDPLGRVASRLEGGDSVVECRDGADVRPQPAVPRAPDDLTQLATIGLTRRGHRGDQRGLCERVLGDVLGPRAALGLTTVQKVLARMSPHHGRELPAEEAPGLVAKEIRRLLTRNPRQPAFARPGEG
jgi:hypothetical protein